MPKKALNAKALSKSARNQGVLQLVIDIILMEEDIIKDLYGSVC